MSFALYDYLYVLLLVFLVGIFFSTHLRNTIRDHMLTVGAVAYYVVGRRGYKVLAGVWERLLGKAPETLQKALGLEVDAKGAENKRKVDTRSASPSKDGKGKGHTLS